jgi:hypothetical protein
MENLNKIAQDLTLFERKLVELSQQKEAAEMRIAQKIERVVYAAQRGHLSDLPYVVRRLEWLEKIATADDTSMATLEHVEKEVESLYGDQTKNEDFYPGRTAASEYEQSWQEVHDMYGDQKKNEDFYFDKESDADYGDQTKNEDFYVQAFLQTEAGKRLASESTLEELKALTTFGGDGRDAEWDGTMNQGFEETRRADHARYAFEEDGHWIDPQDQLNLKQPGPYTQNAPEPLDQEFPLGKHDWPSENGPRMEPIMAAKYQKAMARISAWLRDQHGTRRLSRVQDRVALLSSLQGYYGLSEEQLWGMNQELLKAQDTNLQSRAGSTRIAASLMRIF